MLTKPSHEYLARLDARRAARDRLTRADARCAHARLATFASGVLLALLAWHAGISLWWLLAPAAVFFVWLVRRHAQVLRARELAIRAIAFYERGLARLEDRWAGTGEPGDCFRDDRHVYANDLDLFGRGSLFELLSPARTRMGEARLAKCLMSAADAPEIQARQAAVEELASTLDLREQLALAGADVRASVQTDRLLDWAESPMPPRRTLRKFYAEITRIRMLADIAAGPVPLLFLLDELFHGTNSHDRLMGAAGVLRSLLDRGAIGLITTHDLALTAIADELGPRAVNVHFQDWFEQNDIRFDYRMKPGRSRGATRSR